MTSYTLEAIQARLDGPCVDYLQRQQKRDVAALLVMLEDVTKSFKSFVILGASDPDETVRVTYTRCAVQLRDDLKPCLDLGE